MIKQPNFFVQLVNHKLTVLIRSGRLTFSAVLDDEDLNYFVKDNDLYIGTIKLKTELSTLERQEKIKAKVLKRNIAKIKI